MRASADQQWTRARLQCNKRDGVGTCVAHSNRQPFNGHRCTIALWGRCLLANENTNSSHRLDTMWRKWKWKCIWQWSRERVSRRPSFNRVQITSTWFNYRTDLSMMERRRRRMKKKYGELPVLQHDMRRTICQYARRTMWGFENHLISLQFVDNQMQCGRSVDHWAIHWLTHIDNNIKW